MPRLFGKLPAYRRHKASGQAVVTLAGRDVYLGSWKSAASRAEYQRVTREFLAGSVGSKAGRDELTIVELLAAFMRHAKGYYVGPDGLPTSELASYRTLAHRLAPMYGKMPAAQFGPLKLKAFRESLIDEGLSRNVVNRSVSRVRQIFKWGAGNELVPATIIEALRCVAGLRYGKTEARETEPIKPVPDAVIDATLPHLPCQVRAMVLLQQLTGMRSGEVCRMRGADLNTRGAVWTYKPERHKTQYRGHVRIVHIGPKAQEILRPWLRTNLQDYLFQPLEAEANRREQLHSQRKTPLALGNRPGTNRKRKPKWKPGACYSTGSYARAIRSGCERAFEMPPDLRRPAKGETAERRRERLNAAAAWRAEHCWHPHQLRHNAATFFRRQHGLEVARVLLGHKTAAMTEIYAEADTAKAVEVVNRIG